MNGEQEMPKITTCAFCGGDVVDGQCQNHSEHTLCQVCGAGMSTYSETAQKTICSNPNCSLYDVGIWMLKD